MRAFWQKYRRSLTVAAVIAALYAVMFALGITCPIKYVLGVSCPGCGMTRACLWAVRFDFVAAFHHHPLWVLLLPFAVACAILFRNKKRSALRLLILCGAVLMLAVWLWRMISHAGGDVVVFEPQNGLIGRGIRLIFGAIPR